MPKAAITASSVSAALRRAGFQPNNDRNREGVRVQGGTAAWNPVRVTADFNHIRVAFALADDLASALADLGYTVERTSPDTIVVTKKA